MTKDPIIVSCASQSLPEYLIDRIKPSTETKLPIFALGSSTPNPEPKEQLLLPSCFNLKTKSNCVELEPGNLQVAYTGQGKGGDIDCGTVKGNFPVPPASGIFYYEVTVISKGRDGYIGLGFTTSLTIQQRLPGFGLLLIQDWMIILGDIMLMMVKSIMEVILALFMDQASPLVMKNFNY